MQSSFTYTLKLTHKSSLTSESMRAALSGKIQTTFQKCKIQHSSKFICFRFYTPGKEGYV